MLSFYQYICVCVCVCVQSNSVNNVNFTEEVEHRKRLELYFFQGNQY